MYLDTRIAKRNLESRSIKKTLLFILILCLSVSCADKINQNNLPPPPKKSDRYKNAISQKLLNDYLQNANETPALKKYAAPFDKLEFDKVIAYDYEGNEEGFNSVIKNGNFLPIIEKQHALSEIQIDYLINGVLTSNTTYGETTAACFNPHLGVVFFKGLKPVMVIDICLDCNYLISDIEIPAAEYNKFKFENGEEYAARGFSNQGKHKIVKLAKQLDFYYSNFKIK